MSVGRPAASPTKKDWLRPGGQAGSRSSTRRVPRTVGACGCARPRTRAAAVPAHLRSGSTPALQCSTKKSHMPRPGLRKSSSWVAMKTWCSVARGGVGLVARDDLVQRRRGSQRGATHTPAPARAPPPPPAGATHLHRHLQLSQDVVNAAARLLRRSPRQGALDAALVAAQGGRGGEASEQPLRVGAKRGTRGGQVRARAA